jgi:hypothetical protein
LTWSSPSIETSWRRDDETGAAYALKLTSAGLTAAASMGEEAGDEDSHREGRGLVAKSGAPAAVSDADRSIDSASPNGARQTSSGEPRRGSKIASVIDLLAQPSGANIDELVAATGWLPHTTRAALTGLRKRGFDVAIDKTDRERGSFYRIEAELPRNKTKHLADAVAA